MVDDEYEEESKSSNNEEEDKAINLIVYDQQRGNCCFKDHYRFLCE